MRSLQLLRALVDDAAGLAGQRARDRFELHHVHLGGDADDGLDVVLQLARDREAARDKCAQLGEIFEHRAALIERNKFSHQET